MTIQLTHARAKLRRAREHFDSLNRECGEFFKANPSPVIVEREAEGREYAAYLRWAKLPDVERWGLLTGDCVHNARSALDNAVYGLAVTFTGQDPPPDERRLQFPICDSPAHWNGTRHLAAQKDRIRCLRQDAITVIHDAQPYITGNDLAIAPLHLLGTLNDADKHRVLIPVFMNAAMLKIDGFGGSLTPQSIVVNLDPLEDQAEIARVVLTNPQPKDVQVPFNVQLVIGIQHERAANGSGWSGIGGVLKSVIEEVERIIGLLEALP